MNTTTAPVLATTLVSTASGRSGFSQVREGDGTYPAQATALLAQVPPTFESGVADADGKQRQVPLRVLAVLGGGCNPEAPKTEPERRAAEIEMMDRQLIELGGSGFNGLKAVVASGGTSYINPDGMKKLMITELPMMVQRANSPGNILTLGSLPVMQQLAFKNVEREGAIGVGLEVDPWDDLLNFGSDLNVLVERGFNELFQDSNGDPDFAGDLALRFRWLTSVGTAPGIRLGYLLFNGGGVTKVEGHMAIQLAMSGYCTEGMTVVVVDGSLRYANQLASELRARSGELYESLGGTPDVYDIASGTKSEEINERLRSIGRPHVAIVQSDDIATNVHNALIGLGYINPA